VTIRPEIRLKDIKDRKGHGFHIGGEFDEYGDPVCGCGIQLANEPDFMDASRPSTAAAPTTGWVAPYPAADGYQPPGHELEVPPPFRHANDEPCYGCQSCLANALDDVDLDQPQPYDPDRLEDAGKALTDAHGSGSVSMTPEMPALDPTMPYGPQDIEARILDANNRLERGAIHEANLTAAADQLKIEYELAYARAIEKSTGGAADVRKANATLACERQYRAYREAVAARDAMKGVMHTLRSTQSGYQSVAKSVGAQYQGSRGLGR
jgi:hypothetical protein